MKYKLKELNMNMEIIEYEMYQDIPLKESGSTNLCNGLPYEGFKAYLESNLQENIRILVNMIHQLSLILCMLMIFQWDILV